jgi:hypothetical protein
MSLALKYQYLQGGLVMERKRRPGEDRKNVEGEGSYSGTNDYNERTKQFLKSGKVEKAARDASPQSEEEARAMQKAERMGKQRAKGEDPALRDPKKIKDDPNFPRK